MLVSKFLSVKFDPSPKISVLKRDVQFQWNIKIAKCKIMEECLSIFQFDICNLQWGLADSSRG
jgi:hypothetical protein